jgi:hypothetical protein
MNKIKAYDLRGAFGIAEFEYVVAKIMNFLDSDPSQELFFYPRRERDSRVKFTAEEICADGEISLSLFCMFACAGFVRNAWFPKYSYTVSDDFIERIKESKYLDENIRGYWLKKLA